MAKIRVTMSLEEDTLKNFQKYCKTNGMKVSTKIELMMQEILKKLREQNAK